VTTDQDYSLEVPTDSRRLLALGWLWLCVLALLVAGVFSLLLVVSRTPYVSEIIPWIGFFHSALVVHVDLSVLVWSLAFGGFLWSLNQRPGTAILAWAALALRAGRTAADEQLRARIAASAVLLRPVYVRPGLQPAGAQ
jgi:hypothetical protein